MLPLTLSIITGVIGVVLFLVLIFNFASLFSNFASLDFDDIGKKQGKHVLLAGFLFLDFVAFIACTAWYATTVVY